MSDQPRILHAFKSLRPGIQGGIQRAVAELRVACPGAESVALPVSPGRAIQFWRAARRADLVVIHAPLPAVSLAAALHLPERLALIIHWHSDLGSLLRPIARALLARAHAIVVAAPMLKASPTLTAFQEKVVVVPFGIDTDSWCRPYTSDEAWRISLLRSLYPRLVVAIGRLEPYKGFDVLIEAMRSIDAHLLIVGEGSLRGALHRQIERLGLASRVVLCGAMSQSDLRVTLRAADVFAFPSVLQRETFGIAQLEAMAAGRPVVNTDLPTAVPWVARHGREALTVCPGQPESLAAAIGSLLDDPALARRLGEAGQERARRQFPLAAFRDRVQRLYGGVLTGPDLSMLQAMRRTLATEG